MQKHNIIFGINLIIIIAMFVIYFSSNAIPDTIPTHYNIQGEADSYGDKQHLLVLIAICLGISGLTYYVSKHPEKANYPYEITEENKEGSYKRMNTFMCLLSLFITSIFLLIFLDSAGIIKGRYITYIIYSLILLNPIGIIYLFKNK